MDEQQDTKATMPEHIKKTGKQPNQSALKWVLMLLIVLVLIALCSIGVYYWQHQQLITANNTIGSLNSTNKTLSSKLTDLQSKYNQAESSLKTYQATNTTAPIQDDLGLVVNSAQYVNPSGTVTSGGSWFGVRLTLSNSTSSSINLTAVNFKLKDSTGNTYNQYGFSGATTLPSGWGANTIIDQVITPGSSVTGDVIFQMANKTMTSFTLINGAKTYPVSVN